jgi:hypothetical protein
VGLENKSGARPCRDALKQTKKHALHHKFEKWYSNAVATKQSKIDSKSHKSAVHNMFVCLFFTRSGRLVFASIPDFQNPLFSEYVHVYIISFSILMGVTGMGKKSSGRLALYAATA